MSGNVCLLIDFTMGCVKGLSVIALQVCAQGCIGSVVR